MNKNTILLGRKKMKLLVCIFISLISLAQAQLGLSHEDYERLYGKCLDDGLPSPTGENWKIYDLPAFSAKAAVLFKNKKSIYVSIKREGPFWSKDQIKIRNLFEEGEWISDGKPIPVFNSPSKKIYSCKYGGMNFSHRKKHVQWDRDHQLHQKEFVLKRKPSFGTAYGKIKSIGLGMKSDEVDKIFGEPFSTGENYRRYKKDNCDYMIFFDKKSKASYKVEINPKGIVTSNFLTEIKKKLSTRWVEKGDTMMSSDKRYVLVVNLDEIKVYSAKIASKQEKNLRIDDAPTFHIGWW